jgi:hypothetical protein
VQLAARAVEAGCANHNPSARMIEINPSARMIEIRAEKLCRFKFVSFLVNNLPTCVYTKWCFALYLAMTRFHIRQIWRQKEYCLNVVLYY